MASRTRYASHGSDDPFAQEILGAMGEARMTSKALIVDYDPAVDILTLWNGTPASIATDIAEGVLVFQDDEDEPQIVTIEDASKVLGPLLEQLKRTAEPNGLR